MERLALQRLDPRAQLPRRMSEGAAGMDLCACLPPGETIELRPRERKAVPTGIAMAIPLGYEGQVRPRSGLAARRGITVLNAPGTIDADYRGEVKVLLVNLSDEPFVVEHGDRIAQLVIAAVAMVDAHEVETLPETDRGAGGFGSTGVGEPGRTQSGSSGKLG